MTSRKTLGIFMLAVLGLGPVPSTGVAAEESPRLDSVHGLELVSAQAEVATWRGRRVMRISVCNWQTSERDIAIAIAAVRDAIMSV